MGFFSKLKKFWQADNAPTEETATSPAEPSVAPVSPAPGTEPETSPSLSEAAKETPAPVPDAAADETATEAASVPPAEDVAEEPETPEAAAAPTQPAESADAEGIIELTDAHELSPQPDVPPAVEPQPQPAPAPEPEILHVDAAPQPQTRQADVAPPAPPVAAGPAPVTPAPEVEAKQPVAAPEPAGAQLPAPTADQAPWRNELVLALRQAEPRLSVWLDILLADVETAGPGLWERLRFLFESLEAPADEADAFVAKFADWVAMMEYDEVSLFRSELQYRLALALDLEDEEDERNRLFLKLSEGLAKTKEQIVKRIDGLLGSHTVIDEAFWEELEEILIMADVGFEPASRLLENLRAKVRKRGTTDPAVFKDILREELSEIFRAQKTIKAFNPPEVVMMIGVNGVGKTTTIAKLAHRDMMRGKKVLIAAGDTFRAAAIEQLEIWAKRVGAAFYTKGEGSDPAAVAFEAMDKALTEGFDVLYLDTAGRLHTKTNLMEELRKIHRVVGKKHPGAPHRSVLVLDATTGQNALSQTKLFNEAAGVDEIILTKLDGTAKGGVVVGIALSFGIPITYVGLGEKMEDLRPFDGQDFAQALLGVEETR